MKQNTEQRLLMATQDQEKQGRSFFERARNATILTAAGGSLIFEQLPANEALRINVGLDVLQSTQSSVAVGLTIAGVTAVIEGVSSGLITAGLHSESDAVQRLKDRLSLKNKDVIDSSTQQDTNSKSSRIANEAANVGIALGLGAGLVTLKEHIKDDAPSIKKDVVNSVKATSIVSGVSGAIGYLAAGGINHANGTIFEKPAELFVDYGTDVRFWVGALATGYVIHYAKKGYDTVFRRKNNNAANIEAFLASHGVDISELSATDSAD